MSKSFCLNRIALALSFTTVSLLMAPAAHAGGWTPDTPENDFKSEGQANGETPSNQPFDNPDSPANGSSYQVSVFPKVTYDDNGVPTSEPGDGYAKITMTPKFRMKWTPDSDETEDDLPAKLNLRITLSASASVTNTTDAPAFPNATATLKIGEAAPVEPTVSTYVKSWLKEKYVLKTVSTDGGSWQNGSYYVDIPWEELSAKINVSDATHGALIEAITVAYHNEDPRSVWISSGIEASYKKISAEADLPKKDDGTVDTSKILTSKTPYPGSGPWAVLCERKKNNDNAGSPGEVDSLEVHSVATDNMFSGNWTTRGQYHAVTGNTFANPTYTWEYSGDGEEFPGGPFAEAKIAPSVDDPAMARLALDFKETNDRNDPAFATVNTKFPKSGTIKVTVEDGNDHFIGTNSYKVNWHFPVESIQEYAVGTGANFTKFRSLTTNIPNGGMIPGGETATSFKVTVAPPAAGFEIGGAYRDVVIAVGSAFLGEIYDVPGIPTLTAFLGAAIGKVNFKNYEPVQQDLQNNWGSNLWTRAKDATLSHPNLPPVNQAAPPKSDAEPTFLTFVNDSNGEVKAAFSAGAGSMTEPQGDIFWQSSRLTGVGLRTYFKDRFFKGDEYTHNGYNGVVKATIPHFANDEFVGFYDVTRPVILPSTP